MSQILCCPSLDSRVALDLLSFASKTTTVCSLVLLNCAFILYIQKSMYFKNLSVDLWHGVHLILDGNHWFKKKLTVLWLQQNSVENME